MAIASPGGTKLRIGLFLDRMMAGRADLFWAALSILALAALLIGETFFSRDEGVLRIDHPMSGAVNLTGEAVEVASRIAGALDIRAHDIRLTKDALIAGSITLSGETISLAGEVAGGEIIGQTVVLDGRVNGPLTITADHIALGANAHLLAPLTYRSGEAIRIDPKADLGAAITRIGPAEEGEGERPGPRRWLILALGLGAFTLAARGGAMLGRIRFAFESNIGAALLRGLGALWLPPLILMVMTMTIFTYPLAMVGMVIYGLILACAGAIGIHVMGDWLLLSFGQPLAGGMARRGLSVGCGTVFFFLLAEAMGLLALVLLALVGLGALAARIEHIAEGE